MPVIWEFVIMSLWNIGERGSNKFENSLADYTRHIHKIKPEKKLKVRSIMSIFLPPPHGKRKILHIR